MLSSHICTIVNCLYSKIQYLTRKVETTHSGVYAEMYVNNSMITITEQDTWYPLTNAICNIRKNMLFENNNTIVVQESGIYHISTTKDGSSSENNVNIIQAIFVNNNKISKTSTSRHYQQQNDDGSVSFNGLLSLEKDDRIQFQFSEIKSDKEIIFTIHNCNITLHKIG